MSFWWNDGRPRNSLQHPKLVALNYVVKRALEPFGIVRRDVKGTDGILIFPSSDCYFIEYKMIA